MAEAFARYYGGELVAVESAGTSPKGVNPYTVWAMNETGIDISAHSSDLLDRKNLDNFDYVITLCGDARDTCPALPRDVKSEHWPLADPARIRGSVPDIIRSFRIIRYQVEQRVRDLLARILKPVESVRG